MDAAKLTCDTSTGPPLTLSDALIGLRDASINFLCAKDKWSVSFDNPQRESCSFHLLLN